MVWFALLAYRRVCSLIVARDAALARDAASCSTLRAAQTRLCSLIDAQGSAEHSAPQARYTYVAHAAQVADVGDELRRTTRAMLDLDTVCSTA